ncbi:complexin-like [Limulus polyphemus]|uniref:Complexin-like n=1 Tax=Limulus polyphemus TaxID=6850 RepID=A0ABM1BM14_LIMPO|nr:complexin-like [Limulus polyphemus]
MATFVAKQIMGSKLNVVKGQLAGDNDNQEGKSEADQEEQERLEELKEAEERRKEKHRKMEEEREKFRQDIRDKYGIKKKEEPTMETDQSGATLKPETPGALKAEAENEESDDLKKLKSNLENQVTELKSSVEEKCVLQ